MPTYAENTTVSVERSQAEVERILQRYGASSFMRGWDRERAVLAFTINKRQIRMIVAMPARDDFKYTAQGKLRISADAITASWEQACRQRWRALALVVKAKLEAVEAGISTFEDEFLAHIVLPDGSTTGQWMKPQIQRAYETADMPPLLGSGV